MASREHDMCIDRTADGSVNFYDGGKSRGTACDKGLAARMGGHTWNIINGHEKTEVYFCGLRNPEHPFFLGDARAKFPEDPRGMVKSCLRAPDVHPRQNAMKQRRAEVQMAQTENSFSYRGFQNRCAELFPANPPKRYSIENRRYCYEVEKVRPKEATKQDWAKRRGEQMTHSVSCPSLDLRNPARSLDGAMREDPWKQASQLQTESDHHVPRATAANVACSKDTFPGGRAAALKQRHISVHRVEPGDYSVTKKNNHYSGIDQLTKADPYFMKPQHGRITNSVKYDIINNQRKWFKY